jgi:carbon-monoxide dehydrogenase medium subunit
VKPAPFAYRRPESVEEAVEALAEGGEEARVLAGGQSLVPMMAFRLARPSVLVDINRLPLDRIEVLAGGEVRIGAVVRQRAAERAGVAPLAEALRWVAHPPIRNRGTVVGSVCHADPAAELPALALALGGVLEVRSAEGAREVPVSELLVGPLTTSLRAGDLAVGLRLRPPPGWRWRVREVARRQGDFALAGVVAGVPPDGAACRVAVFGAAGRPYVLEGPADELPALAAAMAEPVSDVHADAAYRRHLVEVLTRRALEAPAA